MLLDKVPFPARQKGDIGLEIECEGRNIIIDPVKPCWIVHHDGSLRGQSAEYVFDKPQPYGKVEKAVRDLYNEFDNRNVELNQSHRTSVHVHVNVQGMTWRQILNYIALYTIFEKPLLELCGEDRVGNLFCLPVYEAEGINLALQEFVSVVNHNDVGAARVRDFFHDNLRYGAINLCAMFKFGSLEFRAMRGDASPDEIIRWVTLLYRMREAAKEYESPVHIIQDFSALGPVECTRKTFGDTGLADGCDSFERKTYEGVRVTQDWCFDCSWERQAQPQEGMVIVDDHMDEEDDEEIRPAPLQVRARRYAMGAHGYNPRREYFRFVDQVDADE